MSTVLCLQKDIKTQLSPSQHVFNHSQHAEHHCYKTFNKKLSHCGEAARCFMPLNILLSHSRSFEMIPLSRACVSSILFGRQVICILIALPVSTSANTPAEGNQRFHLRTESLCILVTNPGRTPPTMTTWAFTHFFRILLLRSLDCFISRPTTLVFIVVTLRFVKVLQTNMNE